MFEYSSTAIVFLCFLGAFIIVWIVKAILRKLQAPSKRRKEIAELEVAMVQASKQNLQDAGATLSKAGLALSPGHTKFPKIFWEVSKIELIARTLITCAKLYNQEYLKKMQKQEQLNIIFPEAVDSFPTWYIFYVLMEDVLKLAKIDPKKAMGISSCICKMDKEGAAGVLFYLARDSDFIR